MTAEEWDQLRWLYNAYEVLEPHKYDRKLRLFTVACLRPSWYHFPDQRVRGIIDLSEEFADDATKYDELAASVEALGSLAWDDPNLIVCDAAVSGSASYSDSARRYLSAVNDLVRYRMLLQGPFARPALGSECQWREQLAFLQLLRCIVGNPFRSVAFDPSWRSETVVALASGIYVERAFDRLPILADALEEAGCDRPDVLSHCRGPGPHARGCWVVDLVLNKS